MRNEQQAGQAGQATRHEIANAAREHYERISMAACDWSSVIPQAIDCWEHHDALVEALREAREFIVQSTPHLHRSAEEADRFIARMMQSAIKIIAKIDAALRAAEDEI